MNNKLQLPDVTLVIIDTDGGEIAARALTDTLSLIEPSDVQLWTTPEGVVTNTECHIIPKITSNKQYGEILWWEVPKHIKTSHMLVVQWDGWVINPRAWTDEFLSYDYIGAVWPWHKKDRVGNGGFSLRSTELMQYMSRQYQPGTHEDDTLCRHYRPWNWHRNKFKVAPEPLAQQFSHEHPLRIYPQYRNHKPGTLLQDPLSQDITDVVPSSFPFGFHDCRNWPWVLTNEQLVYRLELCDKNPYISQKQEYRDLKQALSLSEMMQ